MLVLIVFSLVCFLNGLILGYMFRKTDDRSIAHAIEKETYCHGYEDGFYLGVGDYEPELFRKEIAEKAYCEYKGIKYGPTRH